MLNWGRIGVMSTQAITEFLESRIAEDEALAKVVDANWPAPWHVERGELLHSGPLSGYDRPYITNSDGTYADEHFARHDPARVLAECAAKRAIVEEHGNSESLIHSPLCSTCHDYNDHDAVDWPCPTIKALADIYASHPDYRQEWSVA